MSSRPSRGAARLAAILDALPDALVLVNANGTVVNANSIALEAFEAPGTALVGRGLLDLLPHLKRFDIPVIAITGGMQSTLAKNADVVLDVHVTREACPLNLAPTSSTTTMLVLCDALAMALLEARGFQAEDFARLHPGGSLGRALLTRVSDVMRSGEQPAMRASAT